MWRGWRDSRSIPSQAKRCPRLRRHRELLFQNEQALRQLVAALFETRTERTTRFSKAQLYDYVPDRAGDLEWAEALDAAVQARRWRQAVRH